MSEKNSLMVPEEVVMSKIYLIRGQKVMLDADLAVLYGVSTGNFNKAVRRNIRRFPDDFMFQLTKQEFDNLIFQIGTSSWGGTRKLPYTHSNYQLFFIYVLFFVLIQIKVPKERSRLDFSATHLRLDS